MIDKLRVCVPWRSLKGRLPRTYACDSFLPQGLNMSASNQSKAVLVVENKPLVRMELAAAVEDAGFRVYQAASADEAVGLLEECADIGVLFTDVDMPGSMDGIELAHYARSQQPMKVIVSSGHRKVAIRNLPPAAVFLKKPCHANEIVKQLKSLAL
jgi:DNA-binding NtrC family response regulator